jgi:ribosomal protein S7
MPHSKELLEKIFEAALQEVDKPLTKRPIEAFSQPTRNTPAQTESTEALKPHSPFAPANIEVATPTQEMNEC